MRGPTTGALEDPGGLSAFSNCHFSGFGFSFYFLFHGRLWFAVPAFLTWRAVQKTSRQLQEEALDLKCWSLSLANLFFFFFFFSGFKIKVNWDSITGSSKISDSNKNEARLCCMPAVAVVYLRANSNPPFIPLGLHPTHRQVGERVGRWLDSLAEDLPKVAAGTPGRKK